MPDLGPLQTSHEVADFQAQFAPHVQECGTQLGLPDTAEVACGEHVEVCDADIQAAPEAADVGVMVHPDVADTEVQAVAESEDAEVQATPYMQNVGLQVNSIPSDAMRTIYTLKLDLLEGRERLQVLPGCCPCSWSLGHVTPGDGAEQDAAEAERC